MRILLISFYFPPYNNIGSVRAGKLAKYFTQLGHDVRVVAAADPLFPKALPLEIPEQNVCYTRWINVRRPAEFLAGRREGSAADGNSYAPPKRSITAWLWTMYRALLYAPDMQIGWYPYARRAAGRVAREWKPDLLYASAVPFTSLLVASRLARRLKVPWFAELRDLWVDSHFYAHPAWRRWLEEKVERCMLRSAAGLITVSEPLAETLRAKYTVPVLVAANGFDPGDFPAAPSPAAPREKLQIVYTGGINRCKYDTAPLFQALAALGELCGRIELVFYGSPVDLGIVRAQATRHGVERVLVLKEPVPYRDALKAQCESDVLLFLVWNDEKEGRGVFSGKFFEYAGARRPILAVGPSNNVAAAQIQERKMGLVSHDAGEIAAQLRAWLAEKETSGVLPRLPESASAGFTREVQARAIADFLSLRIQSGATKGSSQNK